jgi:hypothetical protein
MPIVSVGGVEAHDFARDATAVAALRRANYFAPSQLRGVDARLDLPIREEDPAEMEAADNRAAAGDANEPLPAPKTKPKAGAKSAA